jgi:hypothetical protein
MFRHTMATLMLEGGADVRFIQEMLGHATLEATQIYTRVSIKKLKEIHSVSHPGARLESREREGGPSDEGHVEAGAEASRDELLSSLAADAAPKRRVTERKGRMLPRSIAMTRTVIIKGRVVGPQTVELAEPLPEQTSEVEVVAYVETAGRGKLSDILRSFRPGTRSKEDIDRQLDEERAGWD